jgi:hypothetical protein
MRGPLLPHNSHDIDLEFLAYQLEGLVRWIRTKYSSSNGQPWTGNFGLRNYNDPMQDWIAGIGEAQV